MAVDYKNAMVKISGPDLQALRDAFKELPKNIAARVIGAGLKRASKPMMDALKETTPKGPTGNLRRSIKTVVKKYPRDGAAVAVVGYQKAGTGGSSSAGGGTVKKGPDRAFHQFWLEFGTKERWVGKAASTPYARSSRKENKRLRRALGATQGRDLQEQRQAVKQQGGYIASSFNRFGPFKLRAGKGGRVMTTPKYPKAFFIKSRQPISLRAMSSQKPVQTAFIRSRKAVQSNLYNEMTKALTNGIKIVEYNAQKKADMAKLAGHL